MNVLVAKVFPGLALRRCSLGVLILGFHFFFGVDAAAQTAADLETDHVHIVGSCPVYNPDTGLGNNPSNPTNPQSNTFLFRRGTSVHCQILVRNKTAATLDGIALQMVFPRDTWEVVNPGVLSDGDPWYFLLYGQYVHTTTKALQGGTNWSGSPLIPSGYPGGIWDGTNFVYNWTVSGLAAGATREFRVDLRPNYHSDGITNYNINIMADYAGQTAHQVIPARYDSSGAGVTTSSAASLGMLTTDDLLAVHSLSASGASSYYKRSPNTRVTARLPYHDAATGTYKADGLFDVSNPDHEYLFDPATLTGSLNFGKQGTFELPAGRFSGPASGFNVDQMIIYDTVTNTVQLNLGGQPQHYCCPSSSVTFQWSATPTLPLAVGQSIPIQTCFTSDINPGLSCSVTRTMNIVADPYPPIYTFTGRAENQALAPTVGTSAFPRMGNDSATYYGETNVYMQLPGDSERRATIGYTYFNGPWLRWSTFDTETFYISVSTVPSDYGSEGDLSARNVPRTLDSEWVRCSGTNSYSCTPTDIRNQGLEPEDVTEIRFHFPFLAPSIINMGTSGSSNVQWGMTLHREARGSIDGSAYNANDMTRSSVGSKTLMRYDTGTEIKEIVQPFNFEVNRASMTNTFRACHDGNNQEVSVGDTVSFWITSSCTALTTGFRNTGGIENVFGTFDVHTTLPEGFSYDNRAFYPLEQYRPRVYKVMYGGSFSEWTGPVDYAYDPLTRELYVTFDADNPANALFPAGRAWASGEIIGFFIELQGEVLFGAPKDLKTTNTYATMGFEDGMGVRYETQLGPLASTEAHYIVNTSSGVQLSASPSTTTIDTYQPFLLNYSISNPTYDDSGAILVDGASGSAYNSVLYQRITKGGDYPTVENGGIARADYNSSTSPDALEIWLSDWEEPVRDHQGTALSAANGWTLCDPDGAYCGSAEANALFGDRANVRWVAFNFGEILITDTEPRGTAPIDGATRVNNPYTAQIQVNE
ncbi:MAG: hypothetical protein ACNA8W_04870, partial [Bradymonadaceae bacterium]